MGSQHPSDPRKIIDILGTHGPSTAVYFVLAILALFLISARYAITEGTIVNRIISYLINIYLCWRFPITSTDGKTGLPTVPYKFPNGQGNIAKFLEGEAGSRIWEKKFGSIYRIWASFDSEVVLTRSEHIQTVFKDSNMHTKGKAMDSGWLCGEILGQCLGLLNQNDWTRARAPFIDTFHRNKSTSYIPLIERRVVRHFQALQKAEHLEDKHILINPADDLKFLPLWVLCDIIYGDLTADMEAQFQEIVILREGLWNEVISGGISRFSLSRLFPTSTNRRLRMFTEKWTQFNDQAYERARENYPSHPIITFYDAIQQGSLSKMELLHTLDEALFANLDVTIGNFSWIPVFLAAHQSAQDDLRQEIKDARNRESTDSWSQYISGTSTLLMASILESARLKPMAAFSIAQAAPTDRVVGGFVIPAGTNFVVDTQALNILDPYWGRDNTQYRPKRFLDTRNMTDMRYRFWRYGFGPRQCLGKNVADVILKILLAHLVENYRMRLSSGESTDLEDWKRKPGVWISLAIPDIVCEKL
ncbi:hypothetical protein FQN49_004700 [Arthroderma sp. PD_2]|nr:hypothetical protein FQN49_004700 [Arthroderma sp. PD_2]